MRNRLTAAGLADIADKVEARERLTFADAVTLFESTDLLALGWIANRERERRHGDRTYFNHNLRLEATNVCEASCLFCSFARLKEGDPGSHTMSLEQVFAKLRQRGDQPLTEIHIVNGLHPGLPFSYYTDLLTGLKAIRPGIHMKCFTAVEIAFFADHYGKTDRQVLQELKAAGLDSLPGGGAEIFAPRVRQKICHDKCDGARYLAIHRIAHELGMRTNVTMLYGHIETTEERVDHLLQTRALQDDTGGLQAFIPLAFHPDNNQMRKLPAPSAGETLKVHAVARLVLDNVDHIKWHRPRYGLAPTTWTALCRKRRFITWPARPRRRRCRRMTSSSSSETLVASRSSGIRCTTSSEFQLLWCPALAGPCSPPKGGRYIPCR